MTIDDDWPIIDIGALVDNINSGQASQPPPWRDPDQPEPDDPLLTALAGLITDGPNGLLDRITAAWVRVSGPLGDTLYVAFTEEGIAYVRTGAAIHDDINEFAASFRRRFARPLRPGHRPPTGLRTALRTHRTATLAYDLARLTRFERAVLLAVLRIPRGQVRPYMWIAHQVGRPDAVRAVGSALVRNPIPVLIPCHRVIRSDGEIGGYVFGETTKRELLTEEGTNLAEIYELGRIDVRYLGSETTGFVCFPSCANARRISAAHRHGFHTIREAEESGFRPCHHCQPIPTKGTPTD